MHVLCWSCGFRRESVNQDGSDGNSPNLRLPYREFLKFFQMVQLTVTEPFPVLTFIMYVFKYRIIHKSLRNFRPLRYSSRDGHAEGEHVNRGRDTPSFCPTLQVLDMSTLGDAASQVPATHVQRV